MGSEEGTLTFSQIEELNGYKDGKSILGIDDLDEVSEIK